MQQLFWLGVILGINTGFNIGINVNKFKSKNLYYKNLQMDYRLNK